jgi:hypothetical protein
MLIAASGPDVVAQRAAVHACVNRLLGGEVTSLGLDKPIEIIVIYVRHIGDFIT